MDRDKPTSSFVIPKRARLDITQSAPVIPDGYRICKPTNDERERIIAQISKKTSGSLESYWRSVSIHSISMVKNAKLENNFKAYKEKHNAKEEHSGYRFVSDPEDIDTIARDGIRVGCDCFGEIGDTSRGVLMYSSPAVANGGHVVFKNRRITIMMFRTIRGKTLEVPLGSGEKTPSVRHNCHVPYASRDWCIQKNIHQPTREHMQGSVYHYEYLDSQEGVKLYPSQLLPHAILTFEKSDKKTWSSSTHVYQGPIAFQLCGKLDHVISIRKKKLRGHVHRLYHFLAFPAAFYVDLKPSKIYNGKTDLEKFHELSFIRNMKPGQFLNTEITLIDGSGTNTSVAAHFVMTVTKENLPMLKVLRKRCNFLVMSHHPWTVYYIPSGSLASEFGFPFFPDQLHVIVCRQSLHPLTRYNLFIGTDQRDGLYASLVYDYARNIRPDQREIKDDVFSDHPEPERRPSPVVIPVCTTIHPTLLKPVGRGILKDARRPPRKMNVVFREPIDDKSPDNEQEGEKTPVAHNTLSFEEQRREEQRNKEATNLFKGAIQKSREGRIADQFSSSGSRPAGPRSGEVFGQSIGVVPFPPVPPFPIQPMHAPPILPIPPHVMGAPMGVPPPRFNLPPPPIFAPQPGIIPPSFMVPPFNFNAPPPPRPLSGVTREADFSRPPPPTLLPVAPPVASNLKLPLEKPEEKDDDDMDMDISIDEPEVSAVTEMKKSPEFEEAKEEVPMEVDDEKDKEEEKEETNEILKMAFQQTPQANKIMSTLNSLRSRDTLLDIIRAKQTAQDSSAASTSSFRADVDMRANPFLAMNLSKPTPLVKSANLFEESTTGSSESSQDIDYRNRPSSSSQKKVVKDRDDRPKDRDDRVKRDVRILNCIPMPKASSIEEEERKRVEQQIQEKMRANIKSVDQAVMNNQMWMTQQTKSDPKKKEHMLSNLLAFKITPDGLAKANKSPPPPPEKIEPEEPDQIRSPSPEAREEYVPKSFFNSQEAPVIPTDAKEGYTTNFGLEDEKGSQEAATRKPSPKKQRDYDSVPSAPSDKKMQSNWDFLMNQKSSGNEKEDQKNKAGSSGSSVPTVRTEGMDRPPGIHSRGGAGARGNGYGRGRGRGHLLPTPQHAPYPHMPVSNGFQRGRGGHFNNRYPQNRPPIPNYHYLNHLQPPVDPSATNYSIFVDPDLSAVTTQPSDLDALFTDFNKLNRSPSRIFITVFVHENIMNFMRDNKREQRHFFYAFNNFMNNPHSRLIEVLQGHGCDGIGAPKATDMALCMNNVNLRKKGKEAIFLSNSCASDSECGRAFASKRIKVMTIRQLRRYLEQQEHIDFDDL